MGNICLMEYSFNIHSVRVVVIDGGEPWFVARDVCNALEILDVSNACKSLDDDEKGTHIIRTLGGNQEMLCVNEPGLYGLIFKSRKSEAKAFKRWVKHEVLPEIRKSGSYQNSKNLITIDPSKNQPEVLQLAANQAKKLKEQEPLVMIAKEFLAVGESLKGADQVAKELGVGEITLFKTLREENFLFYSYQNGKAINLPYRIHETTNRVVVKNRTSVVKRTDGTVVINKDGTPKKINYS